jgi:hypothetical protein
VIAPDWLGFGGTDKLRDFVAGSDRMIRHMKARIPWRWRSTGPTS